MAKEQVYIVLSHKHSLKPGTSEWEVHESVEFLSQLRNRHHTMSSAIGDYLNQKMISGSRHGFTDYNLFEDYVTKKYKKQMDQLREVYPREVTEDSVESTEPTLITDEFGNKRAPTIFDKV